MIYSNFCIIVELKSLILNIERLEDKVDNLREDDDNEKNQAWTEIVKKRGDTKVKDNRRQGSNCR